MKYKEQHTMQSIPDSHKKIVPAVVSMALFMETLDITILNSAIPTIATELHQYPLNLKIALTSYLLSLGLLIPVSGWLADKYVTQRILLHGIALFGIGSLLCAMSDSLIFLAMARMVQGVSGALMMPVCRLILIKSYTKSEFVSVTNYATIPSLLGPALGPVIGGAIVSHFSWRWIFIINIPFCCFLLYMVYRHLMTFKEEVKKFDILGFVLVGLAISIISFGIEVFTESLLAPSYMALSLSVAAALIVFYCHHARLMEHPFIDKGLLRSKTFVVTVIGSFLSRMGIGGVPFLLTILLQINHDFSPMMFGMHVMPYALAMIIAKFFVKGMLRQIGFRNALILNTFILGMSLASFIFIIATYNSFIILSLIFIQGFFTSIQFSCLNVLTYSDLKQDIAIK